MQNIDRATMIKRAPQQIPLADAAPRAARKLPTLASKAPYDGTGGAHFAKRIEEHPNGILDLAIRVKRDAPHCVVHQADGQRHLQLTAPGFVANAALQTRSQDMQLRLAHRALQAQ